MKIFFRVDGKPPAQQRHRHVLTGRSVRIYDPSARDKKMFLAGVIGYGPSKPFDQPLILTIEAYFKRPKSHYGTGKNAGKLKEGMPYYYTATPDCDNIEKFVMDALNGFFWRDDSVIFSATTSKYYADEPFIKVWVETVEAIREGKL